MFDLPNPVLVSLVVAVAVTVALRVLTSRGRGGDPFKLGAKLKGAGGEWLVNRALKRGLDASAYFLFADVLLRTEDGGTTQVDHIVVSLYGIFVIETKNYDGWIFGSEHQRQWTQQIYSQRYPFQNPLHQNYKHLKTLATMLDLDEAKFFSVVVFSKKCEFKTKMPEQVVRGSKALLRFIRSKRERLFSRDEAVRLAIAIEAGRKLPTRQAKRAHTRHVRSLRERA